MPHKTLMITTGGTIAGRVALEKQDELAKKSAAEFREILAGTINFLERKLEIEIEIQLEELCNEDSSDITPGHWTRMAEIIKKEYDNYNSFIITHGTNTLGYTSAALSFALANLDKPVVLTGSQVAAGLPGSDGLMNLENALRIAVWRGRQGRQVKGVVAVFGSHIITGTRVKKDTEFDYDAFKSFNTSGLGRIGRIIDMNIPNLDKHLKYLVESDFFPPAAKGEQLICDSQFDVRIVSLTEFPGMAPEIFRRLVDTYDVKGFVLRAFGAGDVSHRLHSELEYLRGREIPVVVTTQAPNGNSNFQVNEPGEELRKRGLAIPAYDMSIESQTTKLAWLLAKRGRGQLTYHQLCQEMIRDMRGEINVMWETGV